MKKNLDRLCQQLDYTFTNPNLLKQALTHCSAGSENYERLEFLGDSILSFVIANELFVLFPRNTEGELSRLRAYLVKGDCLAEVGMEIGLGTYLYLGPGELKTGGHRRASILADAMEALIAAVFLDGGFEKAAILIKRLFSSRLKKEALQNNIKDFKTVLQEYLQSKKKPLPEYTLLKTEGDEHEQIFHVSCSVKGLGRASHGQGPTRRKAEQDAAEKMLQYVKK
ncbi:MAG: ribonuclease III [Legionellales bacterium RIFCSPHIGHO2_12_FULL_42_9]|nr:MAG: ribonuclease III [Legionellales bacterium RIFCSPHIGHO2_12_FULL_42_9]